VQSANGRVRFTSAQEAWLLKGVTMLDEAVRRSIDASVLCWLATADADGSPNVSPKEIFAAHDDQRLVIANIASPGSVRNLRVNDRVCVSLVEVFVQKGFKVRGRARLVAASEPGFAELAAPLAHMTQGRYPIHHVIVVEAEAVESIRAPSYQLDPSTTETDQIAAAMAAYGVAPRA